MIILFTVLGMLLALISLLVAHMSWRGWVAGVRAMLQGEGVIRPFSQPRPELQPLVGDLRSLPLPPLPPVPVLLSYGTTLVKGDQIFFFNDIYGHDRVLTQALQQRSRSRAK